MDQVLKIISFPAFSLKRMFAPLGVLVIHIHDHFIPHHRNNYHPHLLSHRSLGLLSALLVTVKIFTIGVITFGPITPAFSSAINTENIINLTNESRAQFNLSALKHNSVLDQAAQTKANDMLAKGYFAHTTPDGHSPWYFITGAGYNYLSAGENLAVNFSEAENVEDAWMNSPGHKANILNKNFEEIGIGIAEGQYQNHTAIFVVQMFGTPSEQQVTLSAKPTEVQKTSVPAPSQVSDVIAANKLSGETLGDQQLNKTLSLAETLSVKNGNVTLEGSNVKISAEVLGAPVKVIAYFGQQAIMLSPKDGNIWGGEVAASTLAQSNQTVKLKAFDISGKTAQLQLADFSANTISNYNVSGSTPIVKAGIFGHFFDPNAFETRFYLLFIAGLLASLVLAIAIKRHIQHVVLIANTSFVIIFASLLMWKG